LKNHKLVFGVVLCASLSLTAACGGKKEGGDNKEGVKVSEGDKKGGDNKAGTDYPGTSEGAKQLVEAFLKKGADAKALTQALKPATDDYAAAFEGDMAGKAQKAYEAMFGGFTVSHKPAQTEAKLWKATTAQLQAPMMASDAKYFPGGYKQAAKHFKKGLTWYRFKFTEPGKDLGMGWDGLVHVNGRWVMFPKPWRAMGLKSTGKNGAMFDNISPYDMKKMLGEKTGGGAAKAGPKDFVKKCEAGNFEACADAGASYLLGKQGMPKDPAKGVPMLKKACDGGSLFGCEIYGRALKRGMGVPKDLAGASKAFTKACDGGKGTSCRALALGMKSDDPKRIPLLQKACDAKDKIGCVGLGAAYLHGNQGTKKDLKKAKEILGKACKLGEKMACKKAAEIK